MTQTFPDYRQAFADLAAELRAHPQFTVERFELGEALSEADIRGLEAETGYELTDDLRAFYGQMNGLRLKWFLNPELTEEERQAFFLEFPDMDVENSSDEYASAAIHILPLKEVLTRDWADEIYYEPEMGFHGQALSVEEFHQSMRPFDMFSDYRACILAFTQKKDPTVFLLDDHHGVWDESKGTDVRSYLNFILATKGQSDARKRWLSEYQGYTQRVSFEAP
ncbi:SMI1/KNR4 family protein [Deinococcus multiflagellatus]|uniref:SMI1/KNR4 family protein n=1 Tax=Deinococcus multiflagellatus TaxID=1656887 RepID=A0ABW1ZRD6_9DEIO|nr:SMI1/KNR4 family protein [Deinococcus multiflagellatus]MBZ9715910.1 SMI1/KNR4 family protein [Deinococcus multiflagellatus]